MSNKPSLLTVGLEPDIERIINDLLEKTEVVTIPMDVDQLMSEVSPPPCLVISGPPKEGLSGAELAQTLRMQYPELPLFLVCNAKSGFERKDFIKNGFTDAFLLPMDTTTLRAKLSDELAKASNGTIRVFRPVKILDVTAEEPLDFETSIFMPVNKRYIKTSNKGDAVDQSLLTKLKSSKMNSMYVPAEQMQNFYSYSAKKLRDMGSKATLSATEKRDKLASSVRDLISGLFTEEAASFESGQAMLKDCGEIVKSYIVQGEDAEWYSRIQAILGERGDNYSHAGNVSTLAALFSMGLGIGKPEDMALAGLLHDIGIAELPGEIQIKAPEDMTPQELEIYKKHPEMSINMIKLRKIIVPEIVMKAILQHHELYNGQGYPNGYFGDRICKEAQILALADKFDYLTCLKEGRPYLSPSEAIEHLRRLQVDDPSKIHYQPDLLKRLLTLFPGGIPTPTHNP